MEYILVTEAIRMNALATLRHLADKNRIAHTTIKMKKSLEAEPTGFYVSMYSSNGINSSLISCAEQVYIQTVSGKWVMVKDTEYPNLSVLIGGLFDDQRIDLDFIHETSVRLQDLNDRIAETQEAALA
ncbi:hypothetical protein D3C71_1761850 [compost metagenome]